MKSQLIAAAAGFVLASGSALAADLPVKAPPPLPPPTPVSVWTGCYVNGGVGYGMWNQDLYAETYPAPVPLASSNTAGGRGWLGKVGAGCDYQFNSRFVIGAFGDYDFMSLSGTIQDPLSGLGGTETERSAWAVGGRVGYLVTPTLLTYVNGGYTGARFDQVNLSTLSSVPSVAVGADITAHTSNGWFIGGGDEVALEWVKGLFWRTEYRYSSYQGADLPIVVTATGAPIGLAEHVQKQVQTIATELVWRFNWPGPVATRY